MRQQQLLRRAPGVLRCFAACQSGVQTVAAYGPWTERQLSSVAVSTSGHEGPKYWHLASLPLLGLAAAGVASADPKDSPQDESFHLLPLASRQRIFFKYERRIRDKSSLDKVFEYFSSQEKDKLKYMTPADLLRAVVPTFPPSESTLDRSGFLDGERGSSALQAAWKKDQTNFFQQFDVDGDGVISYPEFLLVLTLLSIRESDVKTIFDVVDLDGNGVIDFAEFKVVMELLQGMANVHASKVGRSHKLAMTSESGILLSFFGRDGSKKLNLPQFRDFLAALQREVVRLEFAHYDVTGTGSMPALDFARSLVTAADSRHVDQLLDKVDAMSPELRRQRVSYEEFLLLHQLHRGLHTLAVALDFCNQVGRPVHKADFTKLLQKLLGVTLPEHVVDIVFVVFDDGRGALDTTTFIEALQRREVMWARRKHYDRGLSRSNDPPKGRLECIQQCMRGEE